MLNSVIHRDYLSSADIQIKIFDDSITFFNPGKLHDDLSIDDLKTNFYPAYARNKLIAEAFYLTGDIEKYGSGFTRIRDAMSLYPTMKMDFKEIGGGFMVTISYTEQKTSTILSEKGIEKGTEKGIEKETEKETEKGPVKGPVKVTPNQQKILNAIEANPCVTIVELVNFVGISLSKINANISKLKAKGLIERMGPDKGGYWKTFESVV